MKNKTIKSKFLVFIVAILLASILFSGAHFSNNQNIYAENYKIYDEITTNLNSHNWMSGISDGRYLHEINIPGSHDAGTAIVKNSTNNKIKIYGIPIFETGKFAKDQNLNIKSQLNSGVRLLDIRVDSNSNSLYLCHGDSSNDENIKKWKNIVAAATMFNPLLSIGSLSLKVDLVFYCYDDSGNKISFDNVVDEVKLFLKNNPTETILLKVNCEEGNKADFVKIVKKKFDKLFTKTNPSTGKPYIYTESNQYNYLTKIPKIGDCRGQIVILTQHKNEINYGLQFNIGWGSGEQYIGNVKFTTENTYDVNAQDKKYAIKKNLSNLTTIPKNILTHAEQGNVLYTSSNFLTAFDGMESPREIANVINPFFVNSLENGKLYGWVFSDFVDSNFCENIWKTNFKYYQSGVYCNAIYHLNGGTLLGKNHYYIQKFMIGENLKNINQNPQKNDCDFLGWYSDRNCTTKFNFDEIIKYDTHLYAKWSNNNLITEPNINIERKNYDISKNDALLINKNRWYAIMKE